MHNLPEIATECMKELKAAGVPVQENKIIGVKSGSAAETEGAFGICLEDAVCNFTIVIREDLLQDRCPLKDLKEIVIHEMIHTCPRCGAHGKTWQKHAKAMNAEYGYSLLESKDYLSIFHPEKPVCHRYACPKCGSAFHSREEEGLDYRCSFCGSWYEEIT